MNNAAGKIVRMIVAGLMLCLSGSFEACAAAAVKPNDGNQSPVRLIDAPPATGRDPVRPVVLLQTDYAPPKGRTIQVSGGISAARNFQAALDRAMPGDVIALEAGAVFTGNFVLPKKSGNEWIIIRSAVSDTKLPAPGIRLTPPVAVALSKVVSPNAEAALRTAPGAHHYRLIGLEIGVAAGVKTNYGLVQFGDGSQSTLDAVPHDLIIDRCWIHGNPTGDVSRGVALNSASSAVIDSYISDCHGVGFDTQAIAGWNGPGPFKIVNNYLEGAGENVMFGGADPKIRNLVPSDIEFRLNHCVKPLAWKPNDPAYAGTHWTVKNIFELKNAQRVLIDGNVFENNWTDGQNGFAVLFTVRNQDGTAPWSVVQDVTFTNNVVRHSSAGINILGRDNNHPSRQTSRVLIQNNLLEDIGGERWGNTNRLLQLTDTADVTVDHNTMIHSGSIVTAYGEPNTGFVFTNNLTPHNSYGVIGDGTGPGNATLEKYFPAIVFRKNIIIGGRENSYPADNFFPGTFNLPGQGSVTKGAVTLGNHRPMSGTDGRAIGCDLTALEKSQKRGSAGQ
ncbi:MAG: right-handed parallel beta-helix repeat-containing protein [Blastocatellia bacterium]